MSERSLAIRLLNLASQYAPPLLPRAEFSVPREVAARTRGTRTLHPEINALVCSSSLSYTLQFAPREGVVQMHQAACASRALGALAFLMVAPGQASHTITKFGKSVILAQGQSCEFFGGGTDGHGWMDDTAEPTTAPHE